MAITPDTDLYLLKCPIESDQRNQLTFATRAAQESYFSSLPKIALENYSYQRKDNIIRVSQHIDEIMGYNYVMYQNKNYSNRWFYAFITGMSYVSDHCTHISIKTDVYQTWAMDITAKACYVEREHVNDDTVGAHTIPEGLDTGEYICNDIQKIEFAKREYWPSNVIPVTGSGAVMVCVQLTTLTLTKNGVTTQPSNPPLRSIINGVPQGAYIIGIPYTKDAMAGIYSLTGAYDGAGRSDAIISMFLCPVDVCGWTQLQGTGIWNSGYFYKAEDSDTAGSTLGTAISMPAKLDNYTPKNNKLKVAPYNYFHITNNAGSDIEFYYEDFVSNAPIFYTTGSVEQGGSINLVPQNSKRSSYQGDSFVTDGYSEGVMGAKLPQLSWQSDYYLNWEAKNGTNVAIQTGLGAAGMVVNIAGGMLSGGAAQWGNIDATAAYASSHKFNADQTQAAIEATPTNASVGGPLGSVINFASQLANTMNAVRNAKMVPPQAKGNTSGGYLQFADDHCCFTIFKMSVRAEYAKMIDDYFSAVGYKVNEFKIPNFTGRTNWNYVKTVGFNCEGDVPEGDLQEYKNIFNNGITLWHNPSTFMDYSQNNNIIGG